MPTPPAARRPDLAELLKATSRTFALTIEMLPGRLREATRVAYLVLRVSDYLEDNRIMDARAKSALLEMWAEVVEGATPVSRFEKLLETSPLDDIPDAGAVRAAGAINRELEGVCSEARRIVRSHTAATTRGMARWVERGPLFADENDLDDYMHEVAGRVGYLVTRLAALRWRGVERNVEARLPSAREFGLGLQTVNVLRGMRSDRERGWVFVPRSFLPAHVEPVAVFDAANREAGLAVVRALADKAERHLNEATGWLTSLPAEAIRLKIAFALPLLFGVRTLTLCRERPSEVLSSSVKIGRREIRSLVRRTVVLGWSNSWLRSSVRDLLGRRRPT